MLVYQRLVVSVRYALRAYSMAPGGVALEILRRHLVEGRGVVAVRGEGLFEERACGGRVTVDGGALESVGEGVGGAQRVGYVEPRAQLLGPRVEASERGVGLRGGLRQRVGRAVCLDCLLQFGLQARRDACPAPCGAFFVVAVLLLPCRGVVAGGVGRYCGRGAVCGAGVVVQCGCGESRRDEQHRRRGKHLAICCASVHSAFSFTHFILPGLLPPPPQVCVGASCGPAGGDPSGY